MAEGGRVGAGWSRREEGRRVPPSSGGRPVLLHGCWRQLLGVVAPSSSSSASRPVVCLSPLPPAGDNPGNSINAAEACPHNLHVRTLGSGWGGKPE